VPGVAIGVSPGLALKADGIVNTSDLPSRRVDASRHGDAKTL